jgi:hypothetical protein
VTDRALLWVSLSWATFGLVVTDGRVTAAAPLARRTVGRLVGDAVAYWEGRGARVVRLPLPRPLGGPVGAYYGPSEPCHRCANLGVARPGRRRFVVTNPTPGLAGTTRKVTGYVTYGCDPCWGWYTRYRAALVVGQEPPPPPEQGST